MKICLVGSTKFMDRYHKVNAMLTLAGHVVYSVALAEHAGDPITPEQKITLDLVHLRKISESDAICVIGAQPDGTYYIGESTAREIEWAAMNGKQILMERAWHPFENRLIEVWETGGGIGNDRAQLLANCRGGYRDEMLEAQSRAAEAKETVQ